MSVVQHAAAKALFTSGTSGTLTVTLGAATGAGNCLVACVAASNAASATPSVTAVKTGSAAENWAAAKTVNDTTQSGYATIWCDPDTGGGATTVAVTVTFGQTASGSANTVATADVYEVSGTPASSAVDVTVGSSNGNSGTAWSSGTSGTTSQPSEVAFGVALCVPTSGGTATITAPSAYTNSTVQSQAYTGSFGSFTFYGASGYKTLTSAGSVVYNGTASSASYWDACAVSVKFSSAVSGAASLTGSGTMSAGGGPAGAAVLDGEGTLTAAAPGITIPAGASLNGQGTLGGTAEILVPGSGSAGLFGQGALGGTRTVAWAGASALAGRGALTGQETGLELQAASLNGQGTLGFGIGFGIQAALAGAGTLSIPQVAGGLVNGVGGAGTPMALPGSSQVAVAPPGSTNWQWLGTLGQVTALTYSFICPGGCDKLSMTIMCPASYRTQLFNPGWQVKVTRGGHQVWYGKLDEPQASPSGWTLTAAGAGNLSANFTSFYSPNDVWPAGEPDEIVNRAISRGLPWSNPGLNSSPYASQFWLGQGTDPGSQTVTAFLNLICSRGGLVWYVNSQPGGSYGGNNLSVFPLPAAPTRLLVSTTPVSRTLGGYINTIFARFMQTADNTTTNTSASYNVVSTQNAASVAAHGVTEAYVDFSDVGVQTSAQVQAICANILNIYQAASFGGPFTVSYGQLLNMGGQAVDIGCDQAGSMVKLVLTDYAYGGSVTPNDPVTFTIGSYEYNDFAQTATIQPYQSVNESLSGLLSMENTVLTPIAVAST